MAQSEEQHHWDEVRSTPVRVYHLRLSAMQAGVGYLVVLGLGVMFFATVGTGVSLSIHAAFFPWHESPHLVIQIVFVVLGFGGGIAAWLAGLRAYCRWRHNRDRPERLRRLEALMKHPDAPLRLPHRAVEYIIRQRAGGLSCFGDALGNNWPGHVFVLNHWERDKWRSLVPRAVSFEPFSLADDRERLTAFQDGNQLPPTDSWHRTGSTLGTLRGWVATRMLARRITLALLGSFVLAAFVIGLVWAVTERDWRPALWAIVMIVALGLFFGRPVLLRRLFWLAPGMILQENRWLLLGGSSVDLRAPDYDALLIDDRNGTGYFAQGSESVRFAFPPGLGKVVVAGWLSVARRPSPDELQSFFGAES